MSYSLNSFKGNYLGADIGEYSRFKKGDVRSLDYSSYGRYRGDLGPHKK